ncbi:GtrA family protein [Asaccharospora irregularis]|uniref:Putative flippase GtrA (Transmembrane translocase of bactoprenol-linked glucose) n=1 Tax=Asaccharospora irregularis DSM 2635 TaxID=1121321 RepID=A0A1M5KX34_9FIRM|nr:GtrA family protein [Asaccharospora irregularis]SHG57331.1 Putative flippase GtrA (transmembrane translocase of bactoprenol-linked glucose) [Asaccharospora irregularis DSM 2635]
MEKVLYLYKKYKEILLYLFFGVLTTIVSLSTYYFFSEILEIHYLISNVFSWIFAVLFAYITNRLWVFKSKNNDIKSILKEMFAFINCRLLSGAIDMVVMFLLVDILIVNSMYAKLITQIIVVILNYIFSKLIVFKN